MTKYIAKMSTTSPEKIVQIPVPDEFVEKAGLDKFNNFLKGFYPNTKIEFFEVP